jgi:hypothetical protein
MGIGVRRLQEVPFLDPQGRQVAGPDPDHGGGFRGQVSIQEPETAVIVQLAAPECLAGSEGQRLQRLRAIGPGEAAFALVRFQPVLSRRLAVTQPFGQVIGRGDAGIGDGTMARHRPQDARIALAPDRFEQRIQRFPGQERGGCLHTYKG